MSQYSWPYQSICSASPQNGLWVFLKSLVLGMSQSRHFLKKNKIDCVVGVGGFPSVPGVLAAKLLFCKVVLLEQNIIWGKANRFLVYFAHKICVSFPLSETLRLQKLSRMQYQKAIETGNPVRECFYDVKQKKSLILKKELGFKATDRLILVLGGSQGGASD